MCECVDGWSGWEGNYGVNGWTSIYGRSTLTWRVPFSSYCTRARKHSEREAGALHCELKKKKKRSTARYTSQQQGINIKKKGREFSGVFDSSAGGPVPKPRIDTALRSLFFFFVFFER
jgi:hypothetical protein